MQTLPKPVDHQGNAWMPAAVFALCISKVRNPALRRRLMAIRPLIEAAGTAYDAAAAAATLHEVARAANVGAVTAEEMVAVYTDRMAKKGRPGRPVYDRLILAPRNQQCPLCGIGVVKTLDHHLPKAHYPALVVMPNNLIPACHWCQTAKKEAYPGCGTEQTLHPYFDDVGNARWLIATVNQTVPAAFTFSVQGPPGWDPDLVERLRSHMKAFDLATLYAANAARELAGRRGTLRRLHNAGGPDAVRARLQEDATSWEEEMPNSWLTAMYHAAAASDWLCDGGFIPG